MTYQPQHIEAPDGTPLVVITLRDYERLIGSAEGDTEDARDNAAADRALAESDARYPAPVVDAILAGATPIAAWRRYRGLSQSALAAAARIGQTAVARLEKQRKGALSMPYGRRATREAIAVALKVPLDALDPIDGGQAT